MKLYRLLLIGCMVAPSLFLHAQSHEIDKKQFFLDEKPIEATLTTDLDRLISGKSKTEYLNATFTCKMPDSAAFTEGIRIRARGEFRRKTCYIPSLRLNFHNTSSPKLSSLKALKLVCSCKTGNTYEQLLLKEYIAYKIYNLLTPKSFRVRLIKMNYEDVLRKKKQMSQYAFFIEDIKAMAKRNKCKEYTKKVVTENTNRAQMTLVSVFEYMIGNTDWSVPVNHNIRLIYPKDDSTASPFAVAYDFDFSGLVNADYAIPSPELTEIETVRQRLYRGFPRTMAELQVVFTIFKEQKNKIYSTVNNFDLLTSGNRQDIINYLDGFYRTINNQSDVQSVFIDNARRE